MGNKPDMVTDIFRFYDTFCNYPLLPLEGRILAIKKSAQVKFLIFLFSPAFISSRRFMFYQTIILNNNLMTNLVK